MNISLWSWSSLWRRRSASSFCSSTLPAGIESATRLSPHPVFVLVEVEALPVAIVVDLDAVHVGLPAIALRLERVAALPAGARRLVLEVRVRFEVMELLGCDVALCRIGQLRDQRPHAARRLALDDLLRELQ